MRNTLLNRLAALREQKDADDRGFTLIELLVVVVIIGILIAIAIPLYLNYQKGAHDKSAQSDLRAAVSTLQQCYTENGNKYPASGTAQTTPTTALVFTCGTNTETANESDGTTLTYTPSADQASYVMTSTNSGGSGATYTYNSSQGGNIS